MIWDVLLFLAVVGVAWLIIAIVLTLLGMWIG